MSIKSKFSPLGYLFPKTPQVELTIHCNVSVDDIYLNGVSIAQNTDEVTIQVNQGLQCDIYASKDGYNDSLHKQFIIYESKQYDLSLSITELETLYLTVNSGDDGKFIIPFNQYRPVAYNWKIDWGDGTGWHTYSGTGATNSGITYSNYEINHNYTIRIKNNSSSTGWLQAFGFEPTVTGVDTSPSSLHNKNKVLVVDGILDKNMFLSNTYYNILSDYTWAYMFQDCRNLQFGDNFNLPQDIINAGNYVCQFMFQNCILIDDLKNFNLPQSLISCGVNFCYGAFQNCSALTSTGDSFNLPQNLTSCNKNFCNSMFKKCSSLYDLGILNTPQNLTNIEDYTFANMFENDTSLKILNNFNFPQNMKNAPASGFAYRTFCNCTALETLNNMKIPNITSINNNTYKRVDGEINTLMPIYDPSKHHVSYFEQTFYNCTSLKTGIIAFLSNWTNATQQMIDYHWEIHRVFGAGILHVNDYLPYDWSVFRSMFQNCSSIEENITPTIKPLSFTPTVNIISLNSTWDPNYDTRETFANCPDVYVSTLNAAWK